MSYLYGSTRTKIIYYILIIKQLRFLKITPIEPFCSVYKRNKTLVAIERNYQANYF